MAVESLPSLAELRRETCPVTGVLLHRVRALCDPDWNELPPGCQAEIDAFAAAIIDACPGSGDLACQRWLTHLVLRVESASDPATRIDDTVKTNVARLLQILTSHRGEGPRFVLRRESGWFGATTPYGAAYTAVQPDDIAPALSRLSKWHAVHKKAGVLAQLVLWHQLICIHPFRDGNGRFARLATMATATKADHALFLGAYWTLTLEQSEQGGTLRRAHHDAIATGRIDGVIEGLLSCGDQLRSCLIRASATVNWTMRALPAFSNRLLCGEALSRTELAKNMGRSQRVAERILRDAIYHGHLLPNGEFVRLRSPAHSETQAHLQNMQM